MTGPVPRAIPIDPVLKHGYDIRLLRGDLADVVKVLSARDQALRVSADHTPR